MTFFCYWLLVYTSVSDDMEEFKASDELRQSNELHEDSVNVDSETVSGPVQSRRGGLFWSQKGWLNYWTTHFSCFVILSVFGFVLLMAIERLTLVEAWFTAVSAVTLSGLEVVSIDQFTFGGQFVLCLLMALGGWVLSTIPVMILRRRYLQQMVKARAHVEALVEIHALTILLRCVIFCTIASQTLVFISLWIYASASNDVRTYLGSVSVNPVWFSFFHTVSAFNNVGLSNLPLSLVPLRTHTFMLFLLMTSIMVGNTFFPCCLRLLVWLRMRSAKTDQDRAACEFLLSRGRECYTHLFDSHSTRVLLVTNMAFIIFQTVLFCSAEGDNPTLADLSSWHFFINALFNSVSTRTAGLDTVDISSLSDGTQVSMVSMMYIVSYPLLITIRRSRVAPGQSEALYLRGRPRSGSIIQSIDLGLLMPPNESTPASDDPEPEDPEDNDERAGRRRQCPRLPLWCNAANIRRKFTHACSYNVALRDTTLVYVAVLLISYAEGHQYHRSSVFQIVFEVVSAYSTVGFSLVPPGLSFCSRVSPFSKMVIATVMLLARHRGLVNSKDPAVVPPSFVEWHEMQTKLREGEQQSSDRAGVDQMYQADQADQADPLGVRVRVTTTS